MPKNRTFRERDVTEIVKLIRTWPKEKISWAEVVAQAEPLLGFLPSRQGLSQREEILQAFQAKQRGLRISPKESVPMPSSLAIASKRIAKLNAQIQENNMVINRLRDQFIRWQYNAYLKGITEEDLDKPLPQHLGKEEKVKAPKKRQMRRRQTER